MKTHSRIIALFAAFNAMLAAKTPDAFTASGLSGYKSRGHSKAKTFQETFASRTNRQSRSKYLPHVGAKEIAKHERRAEIAVAKRARVDARIDAIAARYPERTPEDRRAIMEANNFYESGVYIV